MTNKKNDKKPSKLDPKKNTGIKEVSHPTPQQPDKLCDLDIPDQFKDVLQDDQFKQVIRNAIESGKLTAMFGIERRLTQISCGPIPPPDMLAEYKNVDKRIMDTFLEQWLTETQHRRDLNREKIAVQKNFNRETFAERKRGQICATLICFAAFLTAAYCVKLGHPMAAGFIGGGALVAIVTAFITGRRPDSKSNDKIKNTIPSESADTEGPPENGE